MCKLSKRGLWRIDPCMKRILLLFKRWRRYEILSCCCGHFKYSMTVVVRDTWSGVILEFLSGKVIKRKKRFYKRDKQGYYYIPEVSNEK